MAILVIPTDSDPYYSIRSRLDGKDYGLSFAWNDREERWYLSIYDDADNLLLAGIKLIANWPLLRNYHADPNVPPGELMVVDQTRDGTPPGLKELGENARCVLCYQEVTALL